MNIIARLFIPAIFCYTYPMGIRNTARVRIVRGSTTPRTVEPVMDIEARKQLRLRQMAKSLRDFNDFMPFLDSSISIGKRDMASIRPMRIKPKDVQLLFDRALEATGLAAAPISYRGSIVLAHSEHYELRVSAQRLLHRDMLEIRLASNIPGASGNFNTAVYNSDDNILNIKFSPPQLYEKGITTERAVPLMREALDLLADFIDGGKN